MKYLYKIIKNNETDYILTDKPYTNTYIASFKQDRDYLFICMDKKGKVKYFLTDKIKKGFPIVKIYDVKTMKLVKIILQERAEYTEKDIDYYISLGKTLEDIKNI